MMNKTQITLIITGFIILALMATNPSIEDHREGVKKMYKEKVAEMNKDKKDDLATQIGTGIGMLIGDGFIDKIVSRDNYLLFSLTNASVGDKTKNIGIGILGQVFIKDYEDLSNDNVVKKDIEINEQSVKLFEKGLNLFYSQSDYSNAEQILKESIKLDNNNYRAYIVLSELLTHRYYTRDYESSLIYINKAINIKPNFDTAFFQRGQVNLELGDYSEAINDFTKTISLNSKYSDAYYYRALIQGGDYGSDQSMNINLEKACSDIKKYMELTPFNVEHYRDKFCK